MLTGIAIFLLLIALLLAIPVTLTFQVYWQQVAKGDIELQWAFGLVRVRLPASRFDAPSTEKEPEQTIDPVARSIQKKRSIFTVFRRKEFRQRIIRFIRDVWHGVHKEHLCLAIRMGLGDPADTGQLWVILGPVAGMLAVVQEASIRIEPDFVDTTFMLDSSGTIRIIPVQMLYLVIALLLSPPFWKGILQLRASGR